MLLILSAHALTLDLKIGTAFPTDIGAQTTLEIPGRIRFTGSIAYLPDPYLDFINNTSVNQGWYDQKTADLIEAALQDSMILRAHIGWRPFPKHGFQFELGYNYMGLGGGLTGTQVIEAATDYWIPEEIGDYFEFSARSSLHRADLTLGWEWVALQHWIFRVDAGGSYTFAAKSKIEPEFDVHWLFEDYVDDLTDKGEDELNTTYKKYVHTPILAFYTGWRF